MASPHPFEKPMSESDLERVRRLLMGDEYAELLRLKDELADDGVFADHVSRIVTEALRARGAADDSITGVLAPIIDQAISSSIDQDPHKLTESLYPIMGPAIRKSITEALQGFLDNFNQLLEQSFSPQSLKWRVDAWRTGRSYSEIALLNTLEYQVEQVFMIHRETSLLIAHASADSATAKDPDIVSSMFSAIQDFIEDSFATQESEALDTLRMGDLNVVIQRGPLAVLAAVVRGMVPENLRDRMRVVLEDVHRLKRSQLIDYGGDPDNFLETQAVLPTLLQSKTRETRQKPPWLALLTLAVVATAIGTWSYFEYQHANASAAIVNLLSGEPGIVVLRHENADGNLSITALVDPLARAPAEVVAGQFDAFVTPAFTLYSHLSADDEIVLRRVLTRVTPETDTATSVVDGTLLLTGQASAQWLRVNDRVLRSVPGVRHVDTLGLVIHNPAVAEIARIEAQLRNFSLDFPQDDAALALDNPSVFTLAAQIREMNLLSTAERGAIPHIDVVGYTDPTGTLENNRRLGHARAEALVAALLAAGLPPDQFAAWSSYDYADSGTTKERKVSLFASPPP